MNFEKMTWKEIEEKLKETQTVVVPLSSLEQHGFHLPVSTDYFISYEVCKRAAEKTNVFCLPPIIIGQNRKGYPYPGTVSVKEGTLKNVVIDMCESLKYTGFKKIIIISGHGATKHVQAIKDALNELNDKQIVFFRVSELVGQLRKEIVEAEIDKHASEYETSVMLYLDEKAVDMSKAASYFPDYPEGDVEAMEYKKANPVGVWGDPTKATKEKGEKFVEKAVETLVEIIEK